MTKTKIIGHIAVDSGQMMLCDPCYVTGDSFDSVDELDIGNNREGPYPLNYEGACNASMNENHAGILSFAHGHEGAAAVFSTGYGDGTYPVSVEYASDKETGGWGERVKSVTITFIEDDELE